MKKYMRVLFLFLLVSLLALPSFAKKKVNWAYIQAVTKSETEKANDQSGVKGFQERKEIDTQEQARATSENNSKGQMMSMVAQAGLAATAAAVAPNVPSGPILAAILMVMSGQAGKQAGEYGNIAGLAGSTSCQSYAFGCGNRSSVDAKKLQGQIPELGSLDGNTNKLRKNPAIAYDPKTNTAKLNGKTIGPNDVSSKSAMAAAGIPQELIDEAWDRAQKISKDAEKKVAALNGGDYFSSGGGSTAMIQEEESAALDGGLAVTRPKFGRDPAGVAGMTKNYYGTPIGVAMDDIFKMMNRRYQLKDRQDSFYDKSDVVLGR